MSEYDTITSGYLSDEQLKEATDSLYKAKFKSGLKVFSDHDGFINGELHTFIGKKGAGKSTWSKTVLGELIYGQKSPLLYISEERKNKYLESINRAMRLMNKSDDQVKEFLENIIVFSEMDEKITTIEQFFRVTRELVLTLGLDIMIVDNFTTSFMSELPITQQSKVLRDIKALADELDIPILMFFHTAKLSDPKALDGDSVRGSGTAINIGSYNYLIKQAGSGSGLRNFIYTEKARYHQKANKQMYEAKYDARVGMFVSCENFSIEQYNEVMSEKKKTKSW